MQPKRVVVYIPVTLGGCYSYCYGALDAESSPAATAEMVIIGTIPSDWLTHTQAKGLADIINLELMEPDAPTEDEDRINMAARGIAGAQAMLRVMQETALKEKKTCDD